MWPKRIKLARDICNIAGNPGYPARSRCSGKSGNQEQNGEGLLDEIMQIIIEGIPLLVAVPEPALDNWRELVGGMCTTIDLTGPKGHKKAWP